MNRSVSDQEIIATFGPSIATFGPSEEGTIMALAQDHYNRGVADYLHFYNQMHGMCPTPFDGIEELLTALRNRKVRIALVTGEGKYSTGICLKKFGLLSFFEIIETGVPTGPGEAEGIEAVVDFFADLQKDEMIYVGDAPSGIVASRKAAYLLLQRHGRKQPNLKY